MPGLLETLRTEFRLPEINGDRCVHAYIETASCKACVTSCPENAWILDDESLGLDTDVCDGCGLCVPACPEGAILQIQDCTIREEEKQKVLLLGCERTGVDESNCKCIHAVSVNELLKLYRDGIHHVFVAVGDCSKCSRGENEHLSKRVGNINKMLRHSHLLPMHYNELPLKYWQDLWKTPEKAAPGPEMSRRMFFRAAIKQTVDRVLHQSTFDNSGEFTPPGKILPALFTVADDGVDKSTELLTYSDEAVYPAIPHINAGKCNGCNACIRACPHDALSFHEEDFQMGHQSSYQIDASACTGCNICVDICDQDAIQVTHWNLQKNNSTFPVIPLSTQKCSSCGIIFHLPEKYQKEIVSNDNNIHNNKLFCTICSQINHQRHLFQVLE